MPAVLLYLRGDITSFFNITQYGINIFAIDCSKHYLEQNYKQVIGFNVNAKQAPVALRNTFLIQHACFLHLLHFLLHVKCPKFSKKIFFCYLYLSFVIISLMFTVITQSELTVIFVNRVA